jgi:hypothetical protein
MFGIMIDDAYDRFGNILPVEKQVAPAHSREGCATLRKVGCEIFWQMSSRGRSGPLSLGLSLIPPGFRHSWSRSSQLDFSREIIAIYCFFNPQVWIPREVPC